MKKTIKLISSMVPVIAAGLLLEISMPHANAGSQVWSDEFNGAVGSAPSSSTWSFQTGGGGWGNGEKEIYTTALNNCHIVSDGGGNTLWIKCSTDTGTWSGQWYSARINTNGKHLITPGHSIGFRVRCPKSGPGYWPGCWMLGTVGGTWPANGEIDVMEQADGQNTIHQSLHMPGWDPTVAVNVPDSSQYFETSAGWAPDGSYVKFWINNAATATFTKAGKPSSATWEFNTNNKIYILINVAIGSGSFAGPPTSSTQVGGGLHVDWVREYTYP